MRWRTLASLVLVAVLASGCGVTVKVGSDPSEVASQEDRSDADKRQLETAATFALADRFGDSRQLSAMISQDDAEQWAEELATIPGSAIDPAQVRFEYPDYLEGQGVIGEYDGIQVLVGSVSTGFMTSCRDETDTTHYHSITLAQSGSGWVVATIDRRDAVTSLLRMSAPGQVCLGNLATVTKAAKTSRAQSKDYVVPASLEELVPAFMSVVPTCPSGGQYSLDDNAVAVCSLHAEYKE